MIAAYQEHSKILSDDYVLLHKLGILLEQANVLLAQGRNLIIEVCNRSFLVCVLQTWKILRVKHVELFML